MVVSPGARRRARSVFALGLLIATGLAVPRPGIAAGGTARYVSTGGSDANPGTLEAPFRTLAKGLSSLRPGYSLFVRGGSYAERITKVSITPGTSSAPILVAAYPNERPVVEGLLWLKNASYWRIDGINVTWGASNTSKEHMVKFTDGTGWTFTNAEVWGAHSYAGVSVHGTPSGWTISHLYVHDTYASNGTNQDHLIYVSAATNGGIVERNLLVNSPNGRAVKLGSASSTKPGPANVVVRYNTMVDNLGPSNIQISYNSHDNRIYRNIMVRPGPDRANVTAHRLTGSGNVVSDNVGWESTRVVEEPDSGYAALVDGGGNVRLDPRFTDAGGDFHPLNPAAVNFGAYAP